MKLKNSILLSFLLCSNWAFSQIQINAIKLNRLNLSDPIDFIIAEENRKLDALIFKTDVWISDNDDNQFKQGIGVIINKANLIAKISEYKSVNTSFLIRLILAHEKMHARQFAKFGNWKKKDSKEQLLLDEVQADMTAGYTAFDFKNDENSKLSVKIIQQMAKNGIDKEPKLSKKDLSFSKELRNDEVNALKLFFSMGENQNYIARHPNSYQRMLAFELGLKASAVKSFDNYVKSMKKKFSEADFNLLEKAVNISESNIDYKNIDTKEYSYFYESWSYWMARRILHMPNNMSKFIIFKLLDGTYSDSTGYGKFRTSVSNTNKNDSIKIDYAVLFKGRPEDKSLGYENDMILSATYSSVILGPNETKIVTDSLLDISKAIDRTKFKLIFPGQFGSLYYADLVNEKNSKQSYKDDIESDLKQCDQCKETVDDLLDNINEIQSFFSFYDIENYINGAGFQNINTEEITYSLFIDNRPFELTVPLDKNKYLITTTIYNSLNINTIQEYLKKIKNKINSSNKITVIESLDKELYGQLVIRSSVGVEIGQLNIVFDKMDNEFQLILTLFKTK